MAKHKEIELKWSADHVNRKDFNRKIEKLLKKLGLEYKFLAAHGPDYYYSNKDGYTARHRDGGDTNELTVKLREGSDHITVRKEINVPLAKEATAMDVRALLKGLGFDDDVHIHKSCDIYFIKSQKADIDVVWYKVTGGGKRPKVFVEVEVGHLGKKDSLKILKKWAKMLEKMFNLKDQSDLSLYEIYSGRRYRQA